MRRALGPLGPWAGAQAGTWDPGARGHGPGPRTKKTLPGRTDATKVSGIGGDERSAEKKEADLAEYRDLMDALDVNGCEGEIEKLQKEIVGFRDSDVEFPF